MAKTKICKYCQTEIPKKAKVCPQCRSKLKGGKFKWLVIAIVIFAVIGSINQKPVSKRTSTVKTAISTSSSSSSQNDVKKPESTPTPAATPQPTPTPTPKQEEPVKSLENTASDNLINGMRPDVKQAIDNYEKFYDEYCDFMEKYTSSDDIASMMFDYLKLVAQAEKFEKDMDAMEKDFNNAELNYFLQASARIESRLLRFAGSLG